MAWMALASAALNAANSPSGAAAPAPGGVSGASPVNVTIGQKASDDLLGQVVQMAGPVLIGLAIAASLGSAFKAMR